MQQLNDVLDTLNIPKLGFGMMRLPIIGTNNADIDLEQVKQMVDHYMSNGLNYIDTAYMYHEQKSENAVKECVVKRYPRDSFYLADKLPVWEMKGAGDAKRIFELQLDRCGVDYFDFYLLHALDGDKIRKHEEYGSIEFCKQMKAEGKIKHLGFSFHGSTEDLKYILEKHHQDMEFVQLQINYYDMEGDYREQYEIVHSYNKPIIVMEPIRGGFLAKLPPQVEEILREADPNQSNVSWALRYAASVEGVFIVLSGMSNLEQLQENVSFMKDFQPLTAEEQAAVKGAAVKMVTIPTVPCTRCQYCYECPVNIPIWDVFSAYNDYLKNKNFGKFKEAYDAFENNAGDCIACGHCESVCPQNINIIDRLAEISALFE